MLETSEARFFLKWNESCPDDMFVREAEGLWELKKAAPDGLVIPEVILCAEPGTAPAYILLEYLDPGHFGDSDEKLGIGLAQMHRYTGTNFGFYHNNYCGLTTQINSWNSLWSSFFAEQRIGHLVTQLRKKGMYSSSENSTFERLIMKIPSLLSGKSVPVLIHGDLWAGNFMISDKGPALIDPAVYYADREMETGIMTLFGGFSSRFWAAYHEENPLPSGWKERNKLYQLYHVLNHYLLFGGGYGRQALDLAKHFL
jgi:fructosamine-3-kinase